MKFINWKKGEPKPITNMLVAIIALGFVLGGIILTGGILIYVFRGNTAIPTEVGLTTIFSGLLVFGVSAFSLILILIRGSS
jgi:hypothetical protein